MSKKEKEKKKAQEAEKEALEQAAEIEENEAADRDKQGGSGEKGGSQAEEKPEKTDKELLTEMTDKYMRAIAEMDNLRKRTSKEKDDLVKFTKGEAIREFLPVLDNLDRAIHAAKNAEDIDSLKKGVEMVIGQFEGVFKKMGVEEVKTKGVFDPEVHHVMHKEYVKGKKGGEIVEVYQKGYMLNGSLVRPAMVKVASDEKEEKPEEAKKED